MIEQSHPARFHIGTAQDFDAMSVLQALADPVRVDIVRQLAACDGEMTCGQLVVPVAKSTASHHCKTLAVAGVIGEREQGRRKYLWLRRAELDDRFPGLIDAVLRATDSDQTDGHADPAHR